MKELAHGLSWLQTPKMHFSSCCCLIAKSCLTLWVPMAILWWLQINSSSLEKYPEIYLILSQHLDLEKAPEIKLPTSVGSSKKQKSSRKTSTSTLLIMPKFWLCGSQQTVENSSRGGNTRPPYPPPEKPVWRENWLQIGKGVHQGCILSPCLFDFHAQYIMQNAGLDEAQAGIKTAGRNINNLRYADDTTLMAESE